MFDNKKRHAIFCFTSYLLIFSFCCASLVSSATANKNNNSTSLAKQQNATSSEETPNRLPLYFEENRGQFDKRVRYMSNANGQTIFLTETEMVYLVRKAEGGGRNTEVPGSRFQVQGSENENPHSDLRTPHSKAVALYVRLAGAESNSPFEATDELQGRLNYFRGNNPANWQTDVRTFSRVNYESVYSGVDMSFYSNEQGEFEYDFLVKPNANPNQISLEIEGASGVRIKENGDLEIETEAGIITQRKPFTYQQRAEGFKQEVESHYIVEDESKSKIENRKSKIRFEVGNYDKTKPLIIDPSVTLNNLAFSTFLGSVASDQGNDIAVDDAGNIYVVGQTTSMFFPTIPGSFDTAQNGTDDVFVTKLNASGTSLIYSTFIGGTGIDQGTGIVLDSSGNAYITGRTFSASFPTTAGSFDTTHNGTGDVFALKLNATGTALNYSTYIGGNDFDEGLDIARDSSNNVYITGRTNGGTTPFPTTANAFDQLFNGVIDAFVLKLDSTGTNLLYSTFLGGSGQEFARGVAVDASDNAYITGPAFDDVTDYPTTPGAFDTTHNGSNDMFVTKLNLTLSGERFYNLFHIHRRHRCGRKRRYCR